MWDVALVGAGNLGKAIADYAGFAGKGFVIKAIFDTDPAKVGKPMGIDNLVVQSVSELAETIHPRASWSASSPRQPRRLRPWRAR